MRYRSLKEYIAFILKYHLDEAVANNMKRVRALNLPILKIFESYSESQIVEISRKSLSAFYQHIVDGTIVEEIMHRHELWKKGELPYLGDYDVVVKDLVHTYNSRKRSLLDLLPKFTDDVGEYQAIADEMEDLFNRLQEIGLANFVQIQEDKIRKEKELNELVISNSLDGVVVFDKEGRVTLWNNGMARITRFKAEDVIGKHLLEVFPFLKGDDEERSLFKVLEGEQVKIKDVPFRTRDGYYEAISVPMFNDQNEVIGGLSFIRDITQETITHNALKESEQNFRLLAENSTDIISRSSADGTFIYVSPSVKDILGYEQDEVIGRHAFDFYHPDDIPTVQEMLQNIDSSSRDILTIRYRSKTRSRGFVWMEATVRGIWSEEGKLHEIHAATRDISRQKKAEDELRENQLFIKQIAEASPNILHLIDIKARKVLYTNRNIMQVLGYPEDRYEEGLEGEGLLHLVHPDDQHKMEVYFGSLKTLSDNEVATVYQRLRAADGNWHYFEVRDTVFKRDPSGNVWQIVGITEDVTEKKQAEELALKSQEELKKRQARLMEAQHIASLGNYEYDLGTAQLDVSPEILKMFALPNDKVVTPQDIFSFIDEQYHASIRENILYAVRHQIAFQSEYEVTIAQGVHKTLLFKMKVVSDVVEQSTKVIGTVQDITERKSVEQELYQAREKLLRINAELEQRVAERTRALAQSEERYRFMADSIPVIVFTTDAQGKIDFLNQKFHDYSGIPVKDALEKGWYVLLHPEEQERVVKRWRSAIAEGREFRSEHRLRNESGSYRWFLVSAVPFRNDQDIVKWYGAAADIDNEKRASQQLQQKEEEYRFLTESVPQIFWITNAKGNTYFYNQRWYEYTGLSPEESMNWGWEKVFHPDDVADTVKVWNECLRTGKPYQKEYRYLRASDGQYRWHLGRAVPLKDDEGNIIKWFGTSTDIHDHKVAIDNIEKAKQELDQVNQELSGKNEELIRINNDLDNFIYTASHDLKAPVSNIEGLLHMMRQSLEDSDLDELRKVVPMIHFSVEKFKNTLLELTEISKVQRNQESMEHIHFGEVLEEVEFSIQDLIVKHKAQIVHDLHDDTVVRFSRKNLRSILYNLLSNSIKYSMPDRRPLIRISTSTVDDFLELSVQDNGMGIPEEQHKKIFQMFKRVHTHVEGTGVGLYIVKKIMENAGGHIEVESKEGKGTTFRLYFKRDM